MLVSGKKPTSPEYMRKELVAHKVLDKMPTPHRQKKKIVSRKW